jgi:lauroyl/myristoyl acyltransferase
MNLVPFAGIAFLWFIGVLRDRLGEFEDRFFSTVFLGSGLLFLAMLFASASLSCQFRGIRPKELQVMSCGSARLEVYLRLEVANSKSRFSRSADYLVYLGYRFIAWILLQLPLPWTFRLGQALGFFGYLVLAKYRKLASANVRIAFPEWTKKQVRKNGREHFQTVTANLLCSLVLTQKPHKANSYIDISELLAAAPKIKAASSVIWVINHIGNWELFILAPRWLQNPLWGVIYQKLSNGYLDRHVQRSRESSGVLTIDRTDGLNRGVTVLRNGGMLGERKN